MIITRNDPTTSKGIHVQNGLGDGEGGDTDRPLAALCMVYLESHNLAFSLHSLLFITDTYV